MSVQASVSDSAGGADAPPPLRLLERPPARPASHPSPARPSGAATLPTPGWLGWARRQLGWAEAPPAGGEGGSAPPR